MLRWDLQRSTELQGTGGAALALHLRAPAERNCICTLASRVDLTAAQSRAVRSTVRDVNSLMQATYHKSKVVLALDMR